MDSESKPQAAETAAEPTTAAESNAGQHTSQENSPPSDQTPDRDPVDAAMPQDSETVPEDPKGAEPNRPETEQAAGGEGRPKFRVQIGSLKDKGKDQGKQAAKADRPKPQTTAPGPEPKEAEPKPRKTFPPPNIRHKLPPELEREVEEALGGASLDDLMAGEGKGSGEGEIAIDSRVSARVVSVRGDDVFVDLGGRNQGIVSATHFEEAPEIGTQHELIVNRVNPDDGLYELSVPGASVDVGNWEDVAEGMAVDAVVTGHNKGGLECEVNKLRGFIPSSQASLYYVENLEDFVGQKLPCLITEADKERRNLVLSHRAVLEREKAAKKEKLMAELATGQIREGIVRNLRDFGAFVDLGGVDGMIHISQLSWGRVKHPSDVLQEGQKVKVKVEKIDEDTGKIGLSYRDLIENPWDTAAEKYRVKSVVKGTVSKTTDFGAFVRLEPGIEGLIHVSELAHRRVWRPSDVVSEGQEVEAQVLSVDPDAQRMSLSMKALQQAPQRQKDEKDEDIEVPETPALKKKGKPASLKGGLERKSGGEQFGLKW